MRRLEASYVWISQSGSKTIDQDIHWGDVVYPINSDLSTKFDFSDLRGSVGYSFYKTSDKELGVGLGLHTLSYKLSLSTLTLGTEAANVLAPLPVISAYGGFALNEHFGFGFGWRGLTLNFQATSGRFVGKLEQSFQGPQLFLTASF